MAAAGHREGHGGHSGCGQPEREPLYSEQELTAQTLPAGWPGAGVRGRLLHLSKQLWGPGPVQLPGMQGAALLPGHWLGVWGGMGRREVSNCGAAQCPVGRASASQRDGEGMRRGGEGRGGDGRLVLGASREACTGAAVTHRRAELREGAQSRKLKQGKGTLRSLGLHPVARRTVCAFEQRSMLKRRLWWRSAGRS